ncbi:MAG: right-handed parallel beta-helix repeat-containing protein, partial [Lachnospiraceae bacterium]|nr:right-handed parallel beta-helix repeat-containing protein [Lachnospiraceae bacterium]
KKSVVIENNQAFDQGGAIYSDTDSTLSIDNAIINNNHCDEEGGGINIFSKYPSTISNSIITNNTTTKIGGGINMEPNPFIIPVAEFDRTKLTITDCKIEGNSADKRGGGIYLDDRGAIEISHTTLKNNTVTEQGGGIYIEEYAVFSADTVTIESNKANEKGGGVYNDGTQTTLTGCPIINNSCGTSEEADDIDDFSGGGVYVAEDAKMTVKTCDITGNSATGNGGGIFADEDADGITFDGIITINSNKATFGTGVYLGEGDDDKITIGSEFDYSSVINEIDAQKHEGVFTSGYSEAQKDNVTTIFVAPKGFSVAYKESEHEVGFASSWKDLQNAINDNNGTNVLQLDQDYTALSDDERLNIPHDITIDLNGHTLNRNMQDKDDDGQVINIEDNKTLTVKNSSENPGVITGGDAKKGGAFMVQDDSTLNIESNVLIRGNKADVDGGAIYVKGKLNITGTQEKPVIIEGNYADDTGGAIYVDSEDDSQMTLEYVTIQSNSSNNSGGAMNLHNKTESTIKNCTITGNSAGSYGGAIRMASSGKTLNITDTKIEENNSADDGGGIFLYQGTIIMNGTADGKCTVSNNTTNNDSGGVKVTDNTEFSATNVKINKNSAAAEEG